MIEFWGENHLSLDRIAYRGRGKWFCNITWWFLVWL